MTGQVLNQPDVIQVHLGAQPGRCTDLPGGLQSDTQVFQSLHNLLFYMNANDCRAVSKNHKQHIYVSHLYVNLGLVEKLDSV